MNTMNTDGRSSRAQALRTRRKSQILKAAIQVIGLKGFHGTSIDDVITASKISRGTFYLYFDSRDRLFEELLDGFLKELRTLIQPIRIEDPGNHLDILIQNMKRLLEFLFKNRDLTMILIRDSSVHSTVVQERLRLLDAYLQRLLMGALHNGVKMNIIRKVNERLAAISIIGSMKEIAYQYLLQSADETLVTDEFVQELCDLYLAGLFKRL